MAFTADGGLRVTFDRGEVGAAPAGRYVVTFSKATVTPGLHPPMLRALGMRRKITLGPWFKPAFRLLASLRRLRWTALDPFGHTAIRRLERELVVEYRQTVEWLLTVLDPTTHALAIEMASLPDIVRGYEEIKVGNVGRYRDRMGELRAKLDTAAVPAARTTGR